MHKKRYSLPSVLVVAAFGLASRVAALDGAGAPELTALAGWDAFELVTQNDDISAFSDSGYGVTAARGRYDGLGAFLDGDTLSIQVNHEVTGDSAISRVDIDLSAFRQAIAHTVNNGATPFPSAIVNGMGYAYDSIFDGTYHAVTNSAPVANGAVAVGNYSAAHFSRFCSGTSYRPHSFGADRGFVDSIYMTGEETFDDFGQFFALDQNTRTLWEVTDVGRASWENAALVDSGAATHVAIVLSEDRSGPAPIRLYVGEKGVDANSDGSIDFLERNGLRGGTVYYFDPEKGASETDLPNGQVSGTWTTSTSGVLREDKIEDVHTNPHNGTQLVIADQTDGVYTIDLDLQFDGNALDTFASSATISQIVPETGDGALGNPDNLTWTSEPVGGRIFVQQDGAGNGIWRMYPDGTERVEIAAAFSEPSGIFDVSEYIGYSPGSVLMTSVQGAGNSGAQLIALISPTAALVFDAADFDTDGDVDGDDFLAWQGGFGLASGAMKSDGDYDNDGDVDGDDFLGWQSEFNSSAGSTSGAVPEPNAIWLTAVAVLGFAIRRRLSA